MGSYETMIDTLSGELTRIEAGFRGLTGPEWDASTLLVPVDPDLPHWTVFELAGHFDISIGLTRMLIEGRDQQQPAPWAAGPTTCTTTWPGCWPPRAARSI